MLFVAIIICCVSAFGLMAIGFLFGAVANELHHKKERINLEKAYKEAIEKYRAKTISVITHTEN